MISHWIAGARPRTLPAAVVPVVLGTASAYYAIPAAQISWWKALCALVVALALQIATNYANDYSDGIRGTDIDRVGPLRLVGSGLVPAPLVKRAAFISFGVAALAGVFLAMAVGYELLLVGLCSILAGWFYTGGSRPYGYMGLGELFVFVFFGLVATIGSAYVQVVSLHTVTVWLAVGTGALATALLVTNNLRDIAGDLQAGKLTLAVRLGEQRTRWFFAALMALPFAITVAFASSSVWFLLAFAAVIPAVRSLRLVLGGATGSELIEALQTSAKTQLIWGLATSVALIVTTLS